MSSRKGDTKKKAQKYQNANSFKNDLHDSSRITKTINCTSVVGVCARCRDAIQWRKTFRKYKPIKAPRKCVKCEQKTIKHAYHVYCSKCAREGGFCEKCGKTEDIVAKPEPSPQEKAVQDSSLQQELKMLSERQRRTYFRHLERGDLDNGTVGGMTSHNMTLEEEEREEDDDDDELMCDDDSKTNIEGKKDGINSRQ